MRLTVEDKTILVETFKDFFGHSDHLWLFGSRVDDSKRGGDIDLYVQTHLPADVAYKKQGDYVIALWDKMGEQKIDVVTHMVDTDFTLPIYKVAQEEGVTVLTVNSKT